MKQETLAEPVDDGLLFRRISSSIKFPLCLCLTLFPAFSSFAFIDVDTLYSQHSIINLRIWGQFKGRGGRGQFYRHLGSLGSLMLFEIMNYDSILCITNILNLLIIDGPTLVDINLKFRGISEISDKKMVS